MPYPEFADWVNVPDSAAVLCAVDGCDHLVCHGGPFLVVYVGTDEDGVAHACVYSSEARAWSPVTSCEHPDPDSFLEVSTSGPKAFVGNALYFPCTLRAIILRYDLLTRELSTITWSAMYKWEHGEHILIRMEGGVLGCASLQESRLELWSMEGGTDGTMKWVIHRVVKLDNLLPFRYRYLISLAEDLGILFMQTDLGIFTIELSSGRVKKICSSNVRVIPYMSFYTPDQSRGIVPPSTIASSSENVEMAREEHHDLLLLHSSGEVGDEKEKCVEKGEEDCEWEEGGWHEEGSVEDWEWDGEKAVHELFQKGCKAIKEGQFVDAKKCFHDVLENRLGVFYYGRLSPMCIGTYYKYGCALLSGAQAKIAQYQDLVEGSGSRDDAGSSNASGRNVRKDLDLAWKMLHIARAILDKSPCIPMEKVDTFCALAEVSMEREDIDYSVHAWLKALAILEHLVEPDHCRVVLLNLRIFLAFESASKIRDALPYALKVFLLYKSRMQKLIRASEALLAVKGDNASATEVDSEMSSLDNEIEVISSIFTVLEEKIKDLVQETLAPTSLTSQIAGPSNSMSTTATVETPGSTEADLETAGQGIAQDNVRQMSAEPCLEKLAEDSSLVKGDGSNMSDAHPAARESDASVSE